ncbi:MAG TPA: UrcA family protein [Candidatus Sulfotelmatobacter sp.]|jgi:UrcA family protein|nr:UrcA family protein [Candidatus Sulfotelmatobacter sp.]
MITVDRIEHIANRKAFRFLVISTLALTFSGAGTTSRASTGMEDTAPRVEVSYADLDLSQMAGVRKLYRQLDFAARQVCAAVEPSNGADLPRLQLWKVCTRNALSRAVVKLDLTTLTAYYLEKNGLYSVPSMTVAKN